MPPIFIRHLGVGSRQDNRGVLLLVAPKERQYRIEVGYGLEPVINDARAGDVGRAMVPALRQQDYSGAILLGVTRLAQFIAADKGVQLNGVPAYQARAPAAEMPSWLPLLVVVVIFFIIGAIFRAIRRGGSGPRSGGGGGLYRVALVPARQCSGRPGLGSWGRRLRWKLGWLFGAAVEDSGALAASVVG